MTAWMQKYPWMPFVAPFATFMLLLSVLPPLGLPPLVEGLLRVGLPALVISLGSGPLQKLRPTRPVATVVVGALVFVLWILPDQLIPGYRDPVLFQNGVIGRVASTMPAEARSDLPVLVLRFLRAAVIVPIVEELFWRGWLPRWIDRMDDFGARPLGAFTGFSFVASSILFGLEHGSFWDVGIVAGAIYNWWMMRTKSLGDLVWCHGVTNALLSGWVIGMGQWQYW